MENIILIAVVGIMNIICFFIGAKIGQKVSQGNEIKVPNPVKVVKEEIKEYQDTKEYREWQEETETNLYNINNYDGTGLGQKSFD